MTYLTEVKLNLKPIFYLFLKISGMVFSVFAILVTFISLEDIGITNIWHKIEIIILILVLSLIMSMILILFFFKKNRIWSNGKNRVFASYGDLIKYAFKVKEKNKRIIVIPVNDTFETIVDVGGEKVVNPLVSPNSLHGIWIEEFCKKYEITVNELNSRISENLKLQNRKPVQIYSEEEKRRGNKEKYDLGTVAILNAGNTMFYLVAISEFDEKNNAQSNKINIRKAVETLIEFYDENGQGFPLYMPLMGTGTSRAKLTHKQSLKLIKSGIFAFEEKINGQINIIVFHKDRDKISIFD